MCAPAQVEFPFAGSRRVRAVFDGGPISSDGGALLLRQVDRRLGLLDSLASVLPDRRDPRYVEHTLIDLLRQRVYGIALGYEDCNDATTLRRDPVLKTCCDRDPFSGRDLGSQPTLSRLENEMGPKSCYLAGRQILESYFVRHPKRPRRRLILDLDTTADPTHGQQEFTAFHAFYDEHIYLPLLIYDQDGDLLTGTSARGGSPRSDQPNCRFPRGGGSTANRSARPFRRNSLQLIRAHAWRSASFTRGSRGFS